MTDKRVGPKVEGSPSCEGCAYERSKSYAVQGDSGFLISCSHPSHGSPRHIGDSNWRTPDWCPVVGREEGGETKKILAGEMKRLDIALRRLRAHLDSISLHLQDERPFGTEVGQSITSASGDVSALLARIDILRRLKEGPLLPKPEWKVLSTDRDGRPTERVWVLPRISGLGGLAVWDFVRSANRYEVMYTVPGSSGTTYNPSGIRFSTQKSLFAHLSELQE